MKDVAKEATKEIAKDLYQDVGKPVAQPTGELAGLLPRAIKAALAPLEKWILHKEYSVAETKKLLEDKLKDTPPELIQPPEPYIAVPAFQYISYCMDNENLRNMYANLLAKSMNTVLKNGVHPGFVEIIKQLTPDEAKILEYFSFEKTAPTISLKFEKENHAGFRYFYKNFSNIGEYVRCEKPFDIPTYFDNLVRLGLLEYSEKVLSLSDKSKYQQLKRHPFIKNKIESASIPDGYKVEIEEGFVRLTAYGKSFCGTCIDSDYLVTYEPLDKEEK